MRKGSPQPIGDVLKNVVERLSQTKKEDVFEIVSAWTSVAGKSLSRHTKPARLTKATLLISVDESAWFYQANLQKDKLLKALQKKVGREKIQKIQFRIGNIKR